MTDLTNILMWDHKFGEATAKTRFGEYRISGPALNERLGYQMYKAFDPDGKCMVEAVDVSDCEVAVWMSYLSRLKDDVGDLKDLMSAAWDQALRAIEKYPQRPDNTPPLTKLLEEVGEVVKAAVKFREGKGTLDHVHDEVIDAMAMLIRLYIEGDETHRLPPVMTAKGGSL